MGYGKRGIAHYRPFCLKKKILTSIFFYLFAHGAKMLRTVEWLKSGQQKHDKKVRLF